jgi:antitoxin VapB
MAESAEETIKVRRRKSLRHNLNVEEDNQQTEQQVVERLTAIARRVSAKPVLDARAPDEIIGYDDIGVPR